MSDDVTISIMVDASQAHAEIDKLMAKADAQVRDWKLRRDEVIRGIRSGMILLSSFMSSVRMFMNLAGQQIDPFFSALISMTMSMVTMLLASGTALAATGIGGVAAAALFAAAISLNVVTIAKLIKDKAEATDNFAEIRANLARIAGEFAARGSL